MDWRLESMARSRFSGLTLLAGLLFGFTAAAYPDPNALRATAGELRSAADGLSREAGNAKQASDNLVNHVVWAGGQACEWSRVVGDWVSSLESEGKDAWYRCNRGPE